MPDLPTITTFGWVPPMARGYVRDLRPRWACEEEGQAYRVKLLAMGETKTEDYRRHCQPFGQVPAYADDEVEMFESGAMAIRIAERGSVLLPEAPGARAKAMQWVIAALNSVEPWVMQLIICDVFEADKPWSPMRRETVRKDLDKRLGELALRLGDQTWLEGDRFTVGDLIMVSVLGGLRETDVLDAHPNLKAYVARGEARPAHRKAMADHLAVFEQGAA